MRLWLERICLLALTAVNHGVCEPVESADAYHPFANETIYRPSQPADNASFGSGLAGSIFDQKRQQPTSIGSIQSGQDGRERKAQESKDTAGTGSGVAIATGSSMIATGAPMIPSIIPSVSAAGVELVAKGILELVQGAASGNAANSNRDQELLLRQGLGGTAPQLGVDESAYDHFGIREKLLTPQMRSLLESRGTDPEQFADAMLADYGSNATEENIARALGISPDHLALARDAESKRLVTDEIIRATASAASSVNSAEHATDAVSMIASMASGDLASAQLLENGAIPTGGSNLEHAFTASLGGGSKNTAQSEGPSDFVANLLKRSGFEVEPGQAPSKTALLQVGIQSHRRRNIFQIARSEYHSFAKWRNSARMAR